MRIDSAGKLLLGLATGVVFGGLLQRGRAARYDVIMKQLLLRDGTVAKIMGTAVAVGAVGVHALVRAGKAKLDIKPLQLGGVVGGGVASERASPYSGIARERPWPPSAKGGATRSLARLEC